MVLEFISGFMVSGIHLLLHQYVIVQTPVTVHAVLPAAFPREQKDGVKWLIPCVIVEGSRWCLCISLKKLKNSALILHGWKGA